MCTYSIIYSNIPTNNRTQNQYCLLKVLILYA